MTPENQGNPSMDPMRIKALDRTFVAIQLLDENNFPKVKAAIMAEDKEAGRKDFIALCKSKGIANSTANAMWQALNPEGGKGSIWP